MKTVYRFIAIAVLGSSIASCASPHGYQGAGLGGTIGAVAGGLIDRRNPWRGAVLGGLLGGIFGGAVAENAHQATVDAAYQRRPVAYETRSPYGHERVEATPYGYDPQTKCTKVHERVYRDGQLVKDNEREVCRSIKTERSY